MAPANQKMGLMITVPALAKFGEVASSPTVSGVRLNTTIPVDVAPKDLLGIIKEEAGSKDVWVDLKCRQLRIKEYLVSIGKDEEVHYLTMSHNLTVDTPTQIYLNDGNYTGDVEKIVNNNTIVVKSRVETRTGLPLALPGKVGIRPGMSVTILDPSLTIDGYLTDKDKEYVAASIENKMHKYMLSFVEQESDITDLLALDPDAEIIAKIESEKGLEFVENHYHKYKDKVRLMAARGDLYMQLAKPDKVIDACYKIIKADPNAILASRLFESLGDPDKIPKCQDISDAYLGMMMGYKSFMVGDEVSLKEDSVRCAIGLFKVMADKYKNLEPPKTLYVSPLKRILQFSKVK